MLGCRRNGRSGRSVSRPSQVRALAPAFVTATKGPVVRHIAQTPPAMATPPASASTRASASRTASSASSVFLPRDQARYVAHGGREEFGCRRRLTDAAGNRLTLRPERRQGVIDGAGVALNLVGQADGGVDIHRAARAAVAERIFVAAVPLKSALHAFFAIEFE